jgi:hypothetical protein
MVWWVVLIVLMLAGVVLFRTASKAHVRVVYEDFEARLTPSAGSTIGGRGKAERERFQAGGEELELRLYELALPDGAKLEVFLRDGSIGHATVDGGRAALLLDNKSGAPVPRVEAGDVIEVRHVGEVILRGVFKED